MLGKIIEKSMLTLKQMNIMALVTLQIMPTTRSVIRVHVFPVNVLRVLHADRVPWSQTAREPWPTSY